MYTFAKRRPRVKITIKVARCSRTYRLCIHACIMEFVFGMSTSINNQYGFIRHVFVTGERASVRIVI